jgi:hypothetical protein
VTDQVVNVVFQLGAPHLEFLDLLIRGEINFLFDAINLVVQTVILIEHVPEVVISALEPPDDLAMFRELPQDGMMKVHGNSLLLQVLRLVCCCRLTANWLESAGERRFSHGRTGFPRLAGSPVAWPFLSAGRQLVASRLFKSIRSLAALGGVP